MAIAAAFVAQSAWCLPLVALALYPGGHNKSVAQHVTLPTFVGGLLALHLWWALYYGRDGLNHAELYYTTFPIMALAVGCLAPVVSLEMGNVDLYYYFIYVCQGFLVLFVGILLNIGYGALGPLCFLLSVVKRQAKGQASPKQVNVELLSRSPRESRESLLF